MKPVVVANPSSSSPSSSSEPGFLRRAGSSRGRAAPPAPGEECRMRNSEVLQPVVDADDADDAL